MKLLNQECQLITRERMMKAGEQAMRDVRDLVTRSQIFPQVITDRDILAIILDAFERARYESEREYL